MILSVDPSVGAIGVARVDERNLVESYTFRTTPKEPLPARLSQITEHFSKYLVDNKDVELVLVEQPDEFLRIGKYGLKNVLPIQILMMSIGAIVGILGQGFKVEFVRVSDWKGNRKKKTTQMLAFHECGRKLNEHESDAYMMCLEWRRTVRFKNAIRRTRREEEVRRMEQDRKDRERKRREVKKEEE